MYLMHTTRTLFLGFALTLGAGLSAAATTGETPPRFLDWAPTPPMGWNSWDCFATTVTEDQTKAQAAFMAAHLKAHGWQ